ncbi:Uma2 family endonuclease [Kitasatospora sp. NPDC087861]|uniref:Uma2 family endonuclease n=1 Tax=Kitasatospora sp. NPDC087861 TaxID=3364070 RepID=UPI00381F420E
MSERKAAGMPGMPQDGPRRETVLAAAAQIRDQLAGHGRVLSGAVVVTPAAPGGLAPDLAVTAPGVEPDGRGRYAGSDVEAVLEVARPHLAETARAYALSGIPLYVMVDPAAAVCLVHTAPSADGAYREAERVPFGNDLFLPLGERTLVLRTEEFPAGPPTPGAGPDAGRGIVDG